jgi:hypothetical protein
MNIIAYVKTSDDPHAVREALRVRYPRAERIAMRAGYMWKETTRAEEGFSHVYCPGYPGISLAYEAQGTKDLSELPDIVFAKPNEIESIPQHESVTIVCPGKFAKLELSAVAIEGPVICVNESALFLPAFEYFIANDGFVKPLNTIETTDVVRVCRRVHAHTIPGGKWFALDKIKIHDGTFTVICALYLAQAMGAKKITLIGHDCTIGVGLATCDWTSGMIESCRKSTQETMEEIAKAGVVVDHIRWDGSKIYHEIYEHKKTAGRKKSK